MSNYSKAKAKAKQKVDRNRKIQLKTLIENINHHYTQMPDKPLSAGIALEHRRTLANFCYTALIQGFIDRATSGVLTELFAVTPSPLPNRGYVRPVYYYLMRSLENELKRLNDEENPEENND